MIFHQDGIIPLPGQIFVFGSNLAGRHGAGAAKIANRQFGARYAHGIGPIGQSYAIPTKDAQLRPLTLARIELHVKVFLDYAAHMYPDVEGAFFVTRIGCGLAGYTDADIAPMFRGAPNNCSFAVQWQPFLTTKENPHVD